MSQMTATENTTDLVEVTAITQALDPSEGHREGDIQVARSFEGDYFIVACLEGPDSGIKTFGDPDSAAEGFVALRDSIAA